MASGDLKRVVALHEASASPSQPRVTSQPRVIREIKFHVAWSYVKRQTAKMKLWPSVFSSMNSRVKIFVFVANSRRHFSIFM